MLSCPDCAAPVDESYTFCESCGTELPDDLFADDGGGGRAGTASCPGCGDAVDASFNFCESCGTELPDDLFDGGDGGGTATAGRNLERHLDARPQGEWVTADRVAEVASLLDPDEVVHYMWKGGTIDVEGSGIGTSLFGNDRGRKSSIQQIHTAVTSERVVVYIPQILGDDERHVPYHSVTSVDLDTGVMARRVSLQTKGQTYHIQAKGPSKAEIRAAMRFIREQVEAANRPQQVQAADEPDPTEQLKNLTELHEEGVLSDAEFAEKKAELLDQI